jgi:cob(I)alamin adenosyltransferase
MGYVHVYTGNGKGKTTSAIGLTIRALGNGGQVAFLQFDKGFEGKNEHYHERFILRTLAGLDMFFFGMERMMPDGKFRFANIPDDFDQARAGLAKAQELISSGKYFMVVCDEALTCVGTKLLAEEDILGLVKAARDGGDCELVLTGRGCFPALVEAADLVSEIQLVKHYFYEGVQARPGIEF